MTRFLLPYVSFRLRLIRGRHIREFKRQIHMVKVKARLSGQRYVGKEKFCIVKKSDENKEIC
jgi:hypothetical protein